MKKKTCISILIITLILPVITFADDLVLLEGKGLPVCEAHFKNLKTLGLNEMVCQRDKSYPEANGITRPKWEVLDLGENKELVKKIEKFLSVGDQFGELEIIDDEKQFERFFLNHPLKYNLLNKTAVNIANDGKSETVMLYREWSAPPKLDKMC